MASILEFTIADEAASCINPQGICTHACSGFAPLGLARPEADDLKRFDPEAFDKLNVLGVVVHDVEVDDFDAIGQLAHINIINQFNHKNEKRLHKHAIAVRLQHDMLIANASPDKELTTAICQVFGNNFHIL